MPESEITIAELWKLVDQGIEAAKEKDSRLQAAENRILKLQQLIPRELQIPKPQEIPELLKGLRQILWGKQS